MNYKRHDIEEMHSIAASKGGKCLSVEYVNIKTHLNWRCSHGHTWSASPDNILRGKWCPLCAGNQKLDIQKLKEHAQLKGGKLITSMYSNIDTPVEWQCRRGHRWLASANNVLKSNGTWCPKCAGNQKGTLAQLQQKAEEYGGKLLSKKYHNRLTKYKWKCSKGHVWEATAANVLIDKHWCHKCGGSAPLTFYDLNQLACERKGQLLSKKYINIDSTYEWQCSNGHKWFATGYKIKSGQWCPYCQNNNLTEEKLRIVMSALFDCEFPKKRPKWLFNDRNKRMELDGFNEELNIAFEYHGVQHFKEGHFTKSSDQLSKRIEDDRKKEDLCRRNNVKLFVIPYTIAPEDFEKEIRSMSLAFGISSSLVEKPTIDLSKAYIINSEYLNQLKSIVELKNGLLQSNTWKGFHGKYKVKCLKHNYTWLSTATDIIHKGTWCKLCGIDSVKESYQIKGQLMLETFAKQHNAELISPRYIDQYEKYEFKCSSGHQVFINWKERNRIKNFCKKCR